MLYDKEAKADTPTPQIRQTRPSSSFDMFITTP